MERISIIPFALKTQHWYLACNDLGEPQMPGEICEVSGSFVWITQSFSILIAP